MKKKLILLLEAGILAVCLLGGCGNAAQKQADASQEVQTMENTISEADDENTVASAETTDEKQGEQVEASTAVSEVSCPLEDGIYLADFDTDSSMFRINETKDGKGVLTVENGQMTIHVTLLSKKILNLYAGLAEDAVKEGAVLLQPTTDVVTYSDGLSEEVYGFDVPVPYLEEEFDVALVGTKGSWYDHKVSVSNPILMGAENLENNNEQQVQDENAQNSVAFAAVTLSGGTGKATIESPAEITYVDGLAFAKLVWSSKNYDYMIVNNEKYMNEAEQGEPSVFTVPVVFGEKMQVIGDTVAMSTPHEIEYTLFLEVQ